MNLKFTLCNFSFSEYHPENNVSLPKNHWRPSALPTVAWNPWTDLRLRDDIKKLNLPFPFGPMPDKTTLKIRQSYAASTTYVDDLIGQLLRSVDNNTIIVLFGDHGWSMGEHGEFSKFSNFEIATRVPLLIHVPELSQKKQYITQPVELVDLFPTLADLVGFSDQIEICPRNKKLKLCTEGKSLVPLLVPWTSKEPWKSAVFSQYPRPGTWPTQRPNSDKPKLNEINIMGYSTRTERYRYTEWVHFNHTTCKPNWSIVYANELYDHLIDPEENFNLATRNPMANVVATLRIKLILGWRYA